MNQFTPHNTRKGEKFVSLDGSVSGTVVECRFCPYARTDIVMVWGWRGERVQFEVKAETIRRA